MANMGAGLDWIGARARYVLFVGCGLALLFPALSQLMRPWLPALVSLVLGLALARVEMFSMLRGYLSFSRLGELALLTLLVMPVTALLLWMLPLPGWARHSALLYALAPPISSAASLCFMMGFNARRALELTLFATLLTPVLGPLMIALLLPELPGVAPLALAAKLFAMVAGGLVIGGVIRKTVGAQRIARLKLRFDGVSALAMVVFVVPLFDGVGEIILTRPWFAATVLAFALLLNFGSNLLMFYGTRQRAGVENAGALGLVWGNRTVALYLAALPWDADFALFVALYQVPMYLTPLMFRRFAGAVA